MSRVISEPPAVSRLESRWVQPAARPPGAVTRRAGIAGVALLAALVLVLFGPFDIRSVGLVEEWDIYGLMSQGHQLFWLRPGGPLGEHSTRPLGAFPYPFAHLLAPDSFVGLNLFEALFFLLKGLFVFAALRQLVPERPGFALVGAALFMVYPADTGLFALRAIGIHGAVCWYLLAVLLLIVYWRRPSPVILVGLWLSLAASLMIYEVAYPLALLTPLLLVWLARGVTRRVVSVAALWYAVPLAIGTWILLSLRQGDHSVTNTLVKESLASPAQIQASSMAMARAFLWHFVEAWKSAAALPATAPHWTALGAATGALFGLTAWYLDRPAARATSVVPVLGRRFWAAVVVVGLVVLAAGYAPYAIVPSHRSPSLIRVHYLASLGSAMTVAGLCYLAGSFHRRLRSVAPVLAGVFVGLATLHALAQHAEYESKARAQQRFLGEMIAQAPTIPPGSTVVVVDESGLLDDEWFFGFPFRLTMALQYVYDTPALNAVMCYPPNPLLKRSPATRDCTFGATSVDVATTTDDLRTTTTTYPYTTALVFRYSLQDELQLLRALPPEYADAATGPTPPTLPQATAPPPSAATQRRQRENLPCLPVDACTVRVVDSLFPPTDRVRIEFNGDERVGLGWRAAEVYPDGLSFRWTVAQQARLNMRLQPGRDYTLTFRVHAAIAPELLDQVAFYINGAPVAVQIQPEPATGGRIYRAILPAAALRDLSQIDELAVAVPRTVVVPGTAYYLGVAVDWLEISPAAAR